MIRTDRLEAGFAAAGEGRFELADLAALAPVDTSIYAIQYR